MNNQDIILAIEAELYDYEPSLSIPGLKEIRTDELILRISERSASIFTNKVVRTNFMNDIEQKINNVIELYQSNKKPFSWWLGPNSKPDDLDTRLQTLGFTLEDTYIGLALSVDQASACMDYCTEWIVEEATTETQVQDHVYVSGLVWGMDSSSIESAERERLSYLSLPNRRGGYLVARDKQLRPVGNATYRISSDGRTMYLVGSAVLPEYRYQGVYRSLLKHRFSIAKSLGCDQLTVQARVGTSEPILRRIGFVEYCKFKVLSMTP